MRRGHRRVKIHGGGKVQLDEVKKGTENRSCGQLETMGEGLKKGPGNSFGERKRKINSNYREDLSILVNGRKEQ